MRFSRHAGRGTVDLGETLRLLGKLEEAHPALERAAELYETKGDVVDAARLREELQTVHPSLTGPV